MGKGYTGRILMVDLGSGEIREELIPEAVYERYLAGLGLGAYMVHERVPAGADPLGPENILGFLPGLLTGTGSVFSGRWMVVGKSPLTGGWGDANCGGTFAPAIKRCGYDGIFFTGISQHPVYLLIQNTRAELRDAGHVWGKDTVETEEILTQESGSAQARVACIGQAGENLSLIAGVCNDRGRIAARSGLGAVMGAKRLKALVLDGRQSIEVHDKAAMKALTAKTLKFLNIKMPLPSAKALPFFGMLLRVLPSQMAQDGLVFKVMLQKWGTIFQNQFSVEAGDSPIRNWQGSRVDYPRAKSDHMNADAFLARETKKYHCYSCPIGCGGICSMQGRYHETHKPEYETVLALGGLVMNDDLESIFYLNEYLNRAGMDTISAGATVAFAIECTARGILTKDQADGLDLSWGNTKAIIALIEKMVKRDGLGDLLADGSAVAARKLGQGSEIYAMHAGGQELPMHDPRNDPGYALHYSAEPTPGRHTIGSQLAYEMYKLWKKVPNLPKARPLYSKNSKYVADARKATMAAACSNYMNVINASGLCWFGAMMGCTRVPTFEWLNAAIGWHKTPAEYMEIGARIQTLKQAINVKHGLDPTKVKIQDRVAGRPPLTEGGNKGRSVQVEKLMSDYWREYGWDEKTGKPGPDALQRYGI